MANKLKKDDQVIVTVGKDKGRNGAIKKIIINKQGVATHAIVEGVRLVKKAKRPNPQAGEQGGLVEQESPIRLANVAIYNTVTKKADRVGFKTDAEGKKIRIFRSSGEQIEV
jgi:large subunit ribosomal protein L24